MRKHGRSRKVKLEDTGRQYKFICGRTELRVPARNSGDLWERMSDSYVDSDMRNEDGDPDLCAGVRVVKGTYAGGKGTA